MARYCTYCGKEIGEEAVVCVNCGCSVEDRSPRKADSDSIGWGFLGFFLPMVGFILWLVWRDETPKRAKSLGIGTLVSVVLCALVLIGYYIFIFVALGLSITEASVICSAIPPII